MDYYEIGGPIGLCDERASCIGGGAVLIPPVCFPSALGLSNKLKNKNTTEFHVRFSTVISFVQSAVLGF